MKATYIRDIFTVKSSTGIFTLYDDNSSILFQCFQLEDVARAIGIKIPKFTCIPEGNNYKIVITQSQRFGRPMPLIYNQPDFSVQDIRGARWTGIRQHPGNFDVDTDGCQVMGDSRIADEVLNSRITFDKYFEILDRAIGQRGFVDYEIINRPEKKT